MLWIPDDYIVVVVQGRFGVTVEYDRVTSGLIVLWSTLSRQATLQRHDIESDAEQKGKV